MSADAAAFAALAAAAAGGAGPPALEGMPVLAARPNVMPFDVLTPAQAAAYLQVGEEVVLHEAEAGRLPGQKLGGQWRFLRMAITEWLRPEAPMSPKPKSSKERMLALAGIWKDDPTVDAMIEEIYRQRKANPVGGK